MIKIHSPHDFIGMKKAGALAARILDQITPAVVEGVTTDGLDALCHDLIKQAGAIPACLGYNGYPKTICTSLNHVVCHGIPDGTILRAGDILNIDITVILDGWYGDTSRMFCIGNVSAAAKALIDTTYQAMMQAIDIVKPGVMLGELGHLIQSMAEARGYAVVRDYCGHGIGRVFHDEPCVLHYGSKNDGPVLRQGMFFTVEPMLNIGSYKVDLCADGWTVVTKDRSLSAQWEHSIGVTESGYEIFTL